MTKKKPCSTSTCGGLRSFDSGLHLCVCLVHCFRQAEPSCVFSMYCSPSEKCRLTVSACCCNLQRAQRCWKPATPSHPWHAPCFLPEEYPQIEILLSDSINCVCLHIIFSREQYNCFCQVRLLKECVPRPSLAKALDLL